MRAYLVTADFPDGSVRKGQTIMLADGVADDPQLSRYVVAAPVPGESLGQQRARLNQVVGRRTCCF